MTTLRSFQNEIEEIHNREVTRQRQITTATTMSEKEKDNRENAAKVMKGKAKENVDTPAAKEEPRRDTQGEARAGSAVDEDDDEILVSGARSH
jgi:hypothetical protein